VGYTEKVNITTL